jgi:hypothetical protein
MDEKLLKQKSRDIVDEIIIHSCLFGRVLEFDYTSNKYVVLDLSKDNFDLAKIDLGNAELFEKYIEDLRVMNNVKLAIGMYDENRIIYDYSDVFYGADRRTIHLGIDLFIKSGENVIAPIDSVVHSFNNNDVDGDYGPTIILRHKLDCVTFYTLYGHLSLNSLDNLYEGKIIKKGGNYWSDW